MTINKTYKFRLYPSIEQEVLINKTFGSTRLVYNNILNKVKENSSLTRYAMNKLIPSLYEEYSFLKEVDSTSLRCAVFDLCNGLDKYYRKQNEFPKFKVKGVKSSYRTSQTISRHKGKIYETIKVNLDKKVITLPKLKEVSIRGYRNLKILPGRIINATISKVGYKYYVSVCVSEEIELSIKKEKNVVGIDIGVKTLVTTSDGKVYDNPKYLDKYEKKIKVLNQKLATKKKGSKNYNKTQMQIEEVYRKQRNDRKHLTDEITNDITKCNDIIVTEKLKVKTMLEKKNNSKNLRKKIVDATFGEIIRKIEYKCKWLNKTFIQVNTYYPSSQLCSSCNYRDKSMKELNKREYICPKCGNRIDRDLNSSINIMIEGVFSYVKNKLETV